MKTEKTFGQSIKKASKVLWRSIPMLMGIILLVSLTSAIIPKTAYSLIFSKIPFIDSIIGSALGSILAGNPITSYVLGGEMLSQGVSLVAVTAFLVAWVTVGLIQLPAEIMLLGKRFAISRNITAFFMAIIIAIVTVVIMGLI